MAEGGESMRLDQFLKCLDTSTQVKINLVTAEPDKEIITVTGIKEDVIPTLISKDISDFDVFDIYEVSIRNITYGSKGEYKYQVIYLLAKENF